MFGLSGVQDLSPDGAALKRFITREPISIFSQIKNVKDEEKKEKLNRLLEALRKELPEGFKIGAAVGEGDCFFDSVAQGLNELKDKGLIIGSRGFSVKSLRESCKQYVQQVSQSKKSSWLDNTLKGEGEKLCEYIPRIEFTAEDIENANSDSEIKILKLENAIWGRPEVEGKMICEKYGVRVKTIELRDEEVGGLHVTTSEVGKGNNVVYIVNYRNHFIPLLSNIEKDIKRSIKVSREEAYGNMVGSNSNNISQLYISTPLQDIESSPHKQGGHSRSSGKENRKTGRKRGRSVTDKDNKAPKRARMDVNVTSNEDSEFPGDLQDEPRQDELHNAYQTNRCIPHQLIGLMYQLDLSVLYSLRKCTYEHKYPSLSLAFEDSEIDKFSNIVLRYEKKSIHIQVENVDKYYMDDGINYARLFTKEKRSFSFINDYFESFVRHLISKSDSLSNDIEYLIIYTNSCLNLTEEKELKKGRFKNFYPFKFDSMDMEECDILKDFLFTNDNAQGCGFYQFSQDKITRKELLKRLECSSAVQKVIKGRKLSQEEIKEKFLDKLAFAVNQHNREELNSIIKNEMEKNSEIQDNYITLQEKILRDLTASKKHKKLGTGIIYEFNLLMFFLHDMFLHKNMFSINFGGKSCDISNGITINYKDRTDYIKAHNAGSNIDYSQLFPSRKQKGKNTFSINKHFSLFVEELKNDMRYFIIYTNADLDLTGKNELKKVLSKGFYPLKFDSIDMEACDILKDFLFINDNTQGCSFYQFSQDKITRKELLKRLECSSAIQKVIKERKFSQEEMKEVFLGKLVFAIDQPGREELSSILKSEVEKNNESNKVPYNYKELHEIALRWLESHEFGPITKGIMEKLFGDIKNNRSSYQKIQKNIDEEIKFARSLVGREGTPSFYQFLNFLIKGEGRRYLEVLKRNEVSLANMSSILHGAGDEAVRAFKDLYNFWFDKEGNKMQCLKTLEKEGINLVNMSSILHGARASAAKTFKDLYDLWFDQNGKKTQYLTKLGENGVDLVRMSSILGGAGANASRAFKDLYDLWFDQNGKKTQYLIKLGENGVDLVRMSSILSGAGANASKAFKDLYNLWFDEEGNKTQCLKTLEKEGMNLANMSSVLHRAGDSASQAFKDLYNLWFDQNGKKTQYLTKPAGNGVDLARMSSILSGAGANASRAFKDLYNLWFDQNGKKTQYLTKLGENGVDLVRMSSVLSGAGANASKAFKDLYNLWFDEEGDTTQYLKTLEKEGMNLANMSSVLHRAGNSAAQAFKDLYNLWFDKRGNKTQYLKILEKERINLSTVFSILHGAGNSAAEAFKDLYDLWFDEQGNKTQYLRNFTEKKDGKKGFTMRNLSGMLGGTGVKIKDAFEKLHNVCFNDEGKRTELLNDFYKAGFRARNLSCMLCGAGARVSSILKKLHSVCFDEKGEKTKLLKDFFDKAGFRPCDLCNILSRAADSLERFHDFCFTKETKQYLNRFLGEKESFTLSNLCNILHGVEANVCSALKDFHDACFDNAGNKTQLLNDFHGAGFRSECLSNILSMAGNNAASILRNFHKSCFSKKNYLSHFLTEEKIFTPEILSKILYGTGTKTCSTFEELHNLCFDKAGNKTDYLNDLIKNNPSNKIINILYEKVRKAPSTFLDNISPQQQDISIIEENKMEDVDDPSTPSVFSYEKQLTNDQKPKRRKDKENLEEQESTGSSSQKDRINRASASQQQGSSLGKRKLESTAQDNRSKRRRTKTKVDTEIFEEERQEVFSHLSEFVSSNFPNASIESTRQGLYSPFFREPGAVDGRCVPITRSFSQVLFLQEERSVLSNLKDLADPNKQISEREFSAFRKLLQDCEQQLCSHIGSLPYNLMYTQDCKTLDSLSNYIAGIESDFAIHLVMIDHVVAIYRTGDNYAYFDCNTVFISGLKSVTQLMQIVEKGVKSAGYKVEKEGLLVEHFDVDKANNLLPDEDKQVLTKEIKTERQLLAEQDEKFGPIKSMVKRVQLYDFGTKINVEGSVPLLINAEMSLSSKKFQDYLDKKEVSMTAREYLKNLKNSKNVEEVVQATKFIPFIGSKREIEEAKQTRKPKQPLLEQLVKGAVNFIASNLTTAFFASVSRSESQLPGKTDDKPKTHLSGVTVSNQLEGSLER